MLFVTLSLKVVFDACVFLIIVSLRKVGLFIPLNFVELTMFRVPSSDTIDSYTESGVYKLLIYVLYPYQILQGRVARCRGGATAARLASS